MRWSWIRQFVSLQAFAALFALIFTIANAEAAKDAFAAIVLGYTAGPLMSAAFMLAVLMQVLAQVIFFLCVPPRPRTYSSLDEYIDRFVGDSEEAYGLRVTERRKYVQEDESKQGQLLAVHVLIALSALFFISAILVFFRSLLEVV